MPYGDLMSAIMLRYLHFNVQGALSLVACAAELAFSRSSGHQNPAPEVGQSHPAQYDLPDGVFSRDAGRSRYACSCTADGLVSQTASYLLRSLACAEGYADMGTPASTKAFSVDSIMA